MIIWYYCDGNFPTCGRIAVRIIIVVVIFVGCVSILVFLACGIITLGTIMVVVFSTDSAMVVIFPLSGIMGVDIALVVISSTCGINGLGVTVVIFHIGSIVEVIAFCFS
jgi:hypothetical protein